MKRLFVIIISLFVIGQASAAYKWEIQESFDNWLKPEPSSANLRATEGFINGETPTDDPTVPISDSPLFVLLLGGLTCGTYVFAKNRKLRRSR